KTAPGLDKTTEIQQAGVKTTGWPSARFAEIVDAGPKKLPEDMLIIADRLPRGQVMPVFTAVNDPVRVPLMILLVAAFGIIISCDVQRSGILRLVRHSHPRQPGGNRTAFVILLHDRGQPLGDSSQAHGIRRIRFITAEDGLRKTAFTASVQYRVRIRVVGVVNLIADAPRKYGEVIAVTPDHI